MNTELTTRGPLSSSIEQVLIGGDLALLKPEERLSYYNRLCESLGLNALTQPFQYIVLNGKLQLYAKKDCTEQLRKIHGVSITKVDPKQIGDLLVVVADAADRDGRVDSSTGAVTVKGCEKKDRNGVVTTYDLKGEDLANAMMKCETKAKRRVTLSICGLGMLDETEVQTLREQGVASEPSGNKWEAAASVISHQTADPAPASSSPPPAAKPPVDPNAEPDIRPRSQKGAQPPTQPPANASTPQSGSGQAIEGEVVNAEPTISQAQGKRFFAIMRSAELSDEQVKQALAGIGYHGHRDEIPKRLYNAAIDAIDPQMRFHTNSK
jgi:hypothetical protein